MKKFAFLSLMLFGVSVSGSSTHTIQSAAKIPDYIICGQHLASIDKNKKSTEPNVDTYELCSDPKHAAKLANANTMLAQCNSAILGIDDSDSKPANAEIKRKATAIRDFIANNDPTPKQCVVHADSHTCTFSSTEKKYWLKKAKKIATSGHDNTLMPTYEHVMASYAWCVSYALAKRSCGETQSYTCSGPLGTSSPLAAYLKAHK